MKIHVIIAQRKCSYPGECAPEVLDACDGYCYDENPTWLDDKLKERRGSGAFESVAVMVVSVSNVEVARILQPNPNVNGTVL